MTSIIASRWRAFGSAKVALGVAIAAAAAVVASAGPAQAQWDRNRGHYYNWNGGYYRSPPIVYGSPYRQRYYVAPRYYPPRYYPPPVVYGPGVTFNFRIR